MKHYQTTIVDPRMLDSWIEGQKAHGRRVVGITTYRFGMTDGNTYTAKQYLVITEPDETEEA